MEPPKTLDDVRAAKGVFPADEIEPGDTVLDLMCAGFWGANAAIHVLDRGATKYHGVDIDAEKIEAMRAIYPREGVTLQVREALECACSADLLSISYDVVICDPWTQGIKQWMPYVFTLRRIARRTVILGTFLGWLSDNGRDPTPESMTAWAKATAAEGWSTDPPTCTRAIRRSDHLGGTFWTVWQ